MRSALWIIGTLVLATVAIVGLLILFKGRDGALALLFGEPRYEAVAFESLVPDGRPNNFLVCPEDLCAAAAGRTSPRFGISAEQLRDKWLAMISAQPRVEMIGANAELLQYEFVQRSAVFAFPDSVSVRFVPLGQEASTLAIYSRSHYGYEDFGVNRARVDAWLAALSEMVAE